MNKLKNIFVCLLVLFFVLIIFTFLRIKSKEDYKQKVVLAQQTRKVLGVLMVDLSQARVNTVLDVPADGMWHDRIAFDRPRSGILEYMIKEGQLFRINNGIASLIADDIGNLRIRRQKETPDILEVQIEAKKNVTLISNIRIRMYR